MNRFSTSGWTTEPASEQEAPRLPTTATRRTSSFVPVSPSLAHCLGEPAVVPGLLPSAAQLRSLFTLCVLKGDRQLAAAGRLDLPSDLRTCENPVITLGLSQPLSHSVGSSTRRPGQVLSGARGRIRDMGEYLHTPWADSQVRRLLRSVPLLSPLVAESTRARERTRADRPRLWRWR